MKSDKKRNIILLIILVIWIIFILLVNLITNYSFNKSESKNNKDDLIEIKMVTEKVIVQGDIVIYEISDVNNINKKNCVVSVLNSNDVIIDEAYIRENRIIIDWITVVRNILVRNMKDVLYYNGVNLNLEFDEEDEEEDNSNDELDYRTDDEKLMHLFM